MKGMLKLCLFVCITLTGCSAWHVPERAEFVGWTDGMAEVVKKVMCVGTYDPGMHSGDLFFCPLSPGVSYGYGDLMALQQSGESLLGDVGALDRLYLFSKLTDGVFICDSVVRRTNEELNDWKFEGRELHLLTSPTYNGRFLLAVPYPLVTDSMGMGGQFVYRSVERFVPFTGKVLAKKELRGAGRKVILTGSGTLVYFRICRPWMDGEVVALHNAGRRLAVVEGIVLARDLQFRLKGGGIVLRMGCGSLIIGYCCRIL